MRDDGCNTIYGKARVAASGAFSVSHFGSTLVGCVGEGAVFYRESDALLEATHARLTHGVLSLFDGSGIQIAAFVR